MKTESVSMGGTKDGVVSEVDIIMVLDRSGSMKGTAEQTVAGFNKFIKEQKEAGDNGTVSLFQFDDEFETVHDAVALSNVPELTQETFVPRGMTALYDAVGKTINKTAERHGSKMPNTVLFVILTDGRENASKEFHTEQIKTLIEEKTTTGWQFIFVGANQDAITTGQSMGISKGSSVNYIDSGKGSDTAFSTLSRNATMYRGMKNWMGVTGQSATTEDFFASTNLSENVADDAGTTSTKMAKSMKTKNDNSKKAKQWKKQ